LFERKELRLQGVQIQKIGKKTRDVGTDLRRTRWLVEFWWKGYTHTGAIASFDPDVKGTLVGNRDGWRKSWGGTDGRKHRERKKGGDYWDPKRWSCE